MWDQPLVFSERAVKLAFQLGRRRVTTGGVPLGYVEECGETRTTLEASFTARLTEEGHYGKTHQQVVNRMGENSGQEASGLLIDPSPEHTAPTHTQ
jgi:hypothetical protein